MRDFRQVFWGQGQFLTPQHLQQQDAFHLEQLHHRVKMIQAHGWGLKHFVVRQEALINQIVDISECEWVSRDGVFLRTGSHIERTNSKIHPRSFNGLLDPSKGGLGVYIGLKKLMPGQDNLEEGSQTTAPGQIRKPFGLSTKDLEDIYDRESPEVTVTFVDYNLSIFFESDQAFQAGKDGIDFIKIGDLQLSSDTGQAEFSKQFIPPCLTLAGSDVLLNILKNIRDLLAGKSQDFAGFVRNRGIRATSSGSQDLLRLFMLQTLHRYIPLLQHWTETPTQHPEPVYAWLRNLVGELSVFSEDINVFGAEMPGENDPLPAYDHDHLWKCFNAVKLKIFDLINQMTAGPEQGIKLEYDGKEYFQAKLPAEFFEGALTRYYLMIDSSVVGMELIARLQTTGKASCMEEMPILRRSAVFGLKVDYLPVPPEELPQKSGRYTYFSIDVRSRQWEGIRQNRNIAVFCDLDPTDTVIKIVKVSGGHE